MNHYKEKKIFITGSNTAVGKTYITNGLLKSLIYQGYTVTPFKPVETGCKKIDHKLIPNDSKKFFNSVDLVSERENKIIYHGHLGPERGISILVKAMDLVRESIQDATLSLFGTFRRNRYEKKLMHQIKILSLEKYIKWNGQLPHFEMCQHLAKYKVGVIPFKDNPLTQLGTPTKLFEYMAAGCQIVCSDLPPMTRYKTGGLIFATPGNANNLPKFPQNLCYGNNSVKNHRIWMKLSANDHFMIIR